VEGGGHRPSCPRAPDHSPGTGPSAADPLRHPLAGLCGVPGPPAAEAAQRGAIHAPAAPKPGRLPGRADLLRRAGCQCPGLDQSRPLCRYLGVARAPVRQPPDPVTEALRPLPERPGRSRATRGGGRLPRTPSGGRDPEHRSPEATEPGVTKQGKNATPHENPGCRAGTRADP